MDNPDFNTRTCRLGLTRSSVPDLGDCVYLDLMESDGFGGFAAAWLDLDVAIAVRDRLTAIIEAHKAEQNE